MSIIRWTPTGRKITGSDWNSLVDLAELTNIPSNPPDGAYKVTNLYVVMVNGEPKLKVEYEEE